ncbi:uncharacterized protein STEHIDRAFT_112337 [Stereum hirsutum FP-91666 SS1]|uniref:uncharacterized protein n=1 Tax=Stereum hirsutum (strain FP-91666) TaxID=721885 RepID=UPI000444A1D1|nr:uncharacterized protein STEHIDRAFT_112337 [Stereum hirsutum FP-91666 SS1]EIM84778.1 hypothetical protein STEHIDRAFT_112337 [Stereum hirsutum FP-91666 SS1]
MSDETSTPEKPLFFRLSTGGEFERRPSIAQTWIEDVIQRQELLYDDSPPGLYLRPDQAPENAECPIWRKVAQTIRPQTTTALTDSDTTSLLSPVLESMDALRVDHSQIAYQWQRPISARSPATDSAGLDPPQRVQYKDSWLTLQRQTGAGFYTIGVFFDNSLKEVPQGGRRVPTPEKYNLYLDTGSRHTWIYHKDLQELQWGENRAEQIRISHDLKKLKEGKQPILLAFSDKTDALIYLTSKGSRMNFQTSPHTDGVTPGMRHVPIEFQFGIAVAANLRMIYQPKEDYHGALGLSLGEIQALTGRHNRHELQDSSITIRILAEDYKAEDPGATFSYVSFGKQWHGPFTPRWSKLIPVVRVALGAPLHDWAILMTQIVIADDNDLDKPIDALDLEKPLRVSLDTGSHHTWLPNVVNVFLQGSIEKVFQVYGRQPTSPDGVVVIPCIPAGLDDLEHKRIGFKFKMRGGETDVVWGRAKSFFTGGRAELSIVKGGGYESYVRQERRNDKGVLGLNFFQTFAVRLNTELKDMPTIQLGSQVSTRQFDLLETEAL